MHMSEQQVTRALNSHPLRVFQVSTQRMNDEVKSKPRGRAFLASGQANSKPN